MNRDPEAMPVNTYTNKKRKKMHIIYIYIYIFICIYIYGHPPPSTDPGSIFPVCSGRGRGGTFPRTSVSNSSSCC